MRLGTAVGATDSAGDLRFNASVDVTDAPNLED
jgi:hypothetical protein